MSPEEICAAVDHRPWPLPAAPWMMLQSWHDLLFMHWPLSPAVLRPLLPAVLPLDTFDGQGWVGVVPFIISGLRVRGLPPLPGLSRFPELNVRTYVSLAGKPGVYFFSLDAGSLSAVFGGRAFYRLPYFYARFQVNLDGDRISYSCGRRVRPRAEYRASYSPLPLSRRPAAGTLEYWLTERYCLYAVTRRSVFRADIHHLPWPLQAAQAGLEVNTMALAAGIPLPHVPPLLHFSRRQDVLVWPLRRI